MTRRKLLKSMAPLAAGATVVTEAGAATSRAFELKPEKRYLLTLQPRDQVLVNRQKGLGRGLDRLCRDLNKRGLNVSGVCLPWNTDLKLYELEPEK